MGSWPEKVGIIGMEIVFPSQYVDQKELEEFDGVGSGKYVHGLGQSKMGFCSDREDINSLCLTVVQKLIDNYNISYSDIGRLEVGTETIIDKSKSVKTVLMQLFEPYGITDIEGIDTTNACYGGTAALFNAISWVESSAWDGRYAIVVCGDIAIYAKGPARPTGGAGAIAMLVGPNAPLVLDRGLRATFMKHAYDFYKPDLTSQYPVVDGKLSIQCYLTALDNCYQLYLKKLRNHDIYAEVNLNSLDYIVFHTPFCKLVQKSIARLVLNDFLSTPHDLLVDLYPTLDSFKNIKLSDSYFDKDVEKAFVSFSKNIFEKKTVPSLLIANQIGNMYTPSLYGGLISLLINERIDELAGRRVGLFSYGSGLAATMYSITVSKDCNDNSPLSKLMSTLSNVKKQLEIRKKVSPEKFTSIIELTSKNFNKVPYKPIGNVDDLFCGTFYLTQVDDKYRRYYKKYSGAATNGSVSDNEL